METIEHLAQEIRQLNAKLRQQGEELIRLRQLNEAQLTEAKKLMNEAQLAQEWARHSFRVDENGWIWRWDFDRKLYVKTTNRVNTPVIPCDAISTKNIKDNAITPQKIENGAVTGLKIAENAVQSGHVMAGSILGRHIASANILLKHLSPNVLATLKKDLQNQIDALVIGGLALSNEFGDNPHIGVSQKKLSWFVNYVLTLLEEALGRTLLGFTWNVTTTYIYGEWPTTVHITAQPTNEGDLFEHIRLYSNDELVDEVTVFTDSYSFDINLQQTANIRIEAQLLGTVYERTQKINHYDSFWLGGGATYADVMIEADNINFSEGTRLSKDVTVADGEHIIIMMGDTWVPAFIRADMNGAEIEFDESTVTVDGKNYKVLTSKSVFEAGTYNIDING